MGGVTVVASGNNLTVNTSQKIASAAIQDVWDAEGSTGKNTFVDNNDTEIKTFFNDQLITLSSDASTAVINIESNGGTLTAKEKYFVGVWVDRLVANSDWDEIPFLAYGGFADNTCNLSDWKTGILMINSGATFDGANWVFDGASHIDTNHSESDGTVTQLDHMIGAYMEEVTDTGSIVSLFGSLDSAVDTSNRNYIQYRFNQAIPDFYWFLDTNTRNDIKTPLLKKSLMTIERTGASVQTFYINGEVFQNAARSVTGTALSTMSNYIGGINTNGVAQGMITGKVSMFFTALPSTLDHLDFYAGFEDFRTSLHPEILYNIPPATGQTVSYRTGDDADIESTVFTHYRKAMSYWNGTAPKLIDFTTLTPDTLNIFGGQDRFTDVDGLQVYTDNYKIDHYTSLGWYINNDSPISQTWDICIDGGLAFTLAGYSDYFLNNLNQFQSIWQLGDTTDIGISYAPFNYPFTVYGWTSSTDPLPTTNALRINAKTPVLNIQVKTSGNHFWYCRKHY